MPNRRSASALAIALYEALDGATFLPPDIRPLGDMDANDAPSGAGEALAALGPPLSDATRIGTLASLVMKFHESRGGLPPASALVAARELARLLDQAALSGGADWDSLPGLVTDADIAHHWEDSVRFLDIVRKIWPDWLEAQGVMDPFARRIAAAEALAVHWQAVPPAGPVVIAGSTGATPDTRILMKAAMDLKQGCVVLPGLDLEMETSEIRRTPSHPQYALAGTLNALDLDLTDIPVWPGADETVAGKARRRLVHEALAPAAATADWLDRLEQLSEDDSLEAFTANALTGLTLIEAEDEAEEAISAALLMRETLETPGRTAALVTPDAGLARRVSALLKRWGIMVAPSSGTPLLQTPPGSFVALILDWALDPGDPVALCAVLKHELARFDEADVLVLERCILRGPRRWTDLADLEAHIPQRVQAEKTSPYSPLDEDTGQIAARLIAELNQSCGHALEPFKSETIDGPVAVQTLAALASSISPGADLWSGEDGAGTGQMLEAFAELAAPLGALPTHTLPGLMETVAMDRSVRPSAPDHPRLAIWGDLEARLQSADRIILAGLDEGVWPQRPAADAFLPRRFRQTLGLESPEARLGLSAHDFAQLACAPDVVMLRSKRRDDAPAVTSRWIWRLRTLAEGALGPDEARRQLGPEPGYDPRLWADALGKVDPLPNEFSSEPKPSPPLSARATQFSVTRINTLQRDPYAIYAEFILALSELDPLNAELDARQRGTATHEALERYEDEGTEKSAPRLLTLLEDELRLAGESEDTLAGSRAVNRRKIGEYLDTWRTPRLDSIEGKPVLEASGKLKLTIGEMNFTLSAKADRIDRLKAGGLSIVDFKTGAAPSNKQIGAGLEQQMPLQALIAQEGEFKGVTSGEVTELNYVAFKAEFKSTQIKGANKPPETPSELATLAKDGLIRLIDMYNDPTRPYLSAPRTQFIKYESAYTRLARRAEWAGDTSDE